MKIEEVKTTNLISESELKDFWGIPKGASLDFYHEQLVALKQGEEYAPIELPRGAFKVQLWQPCPYCGRKDKLDECKGCGHA